MRRPRHDGVLRSGEVAYRMKYPTRGSTHRIMTPVELLARLSTLIPPPRYPLVRYHGVFAPHAKRRSAVVPRPERTRCTSDLGTGEAFAEKAGRTPALEQGGAGQKAKERGPQTSEARSAGGTSVQRPRRTTKQGNEMKALSVTVVPPPGDLPVFGLEGGRARNGSTTAILSPARVFSVTQGISARHLDRLLGGLLLAMSPRVPWAQLLRRTYQIDMLFCTGCGGEMRLSGAVTEPAVAREILTRLGLPLEAPECRARDPTDGMTWSDGPTCAE
ncbi:transposase [Sorangium sp. So ce1128]